MPPHDYQLQLVPAMLRELRPDVRIGWFDHIPFPSVELFAQLPWRRQVIEGLLGADLLGFQRRADAENFLRVSRRLLGLSTRGHTVTVPGADGTQRASMRQLGSTGKLSMPRKAVRAGDCGSLMRRPLRPSRSIT